MEVFKLVGRIALDGQKKVQSGLEGISRKAQELAGKMEKVGEKVKGFGEGMETAADTMSTRVTAPIVAVGGMAAIAANDIQAANGKIAASLGISEDAAKDFTGVAQNLWKQGFGENLQEATDGVITVSQVLSDLPAEDLEKVTGMAFTLKDAFGAEVTQSVATADVMMANFGITADKAMDLMTVGFQNGGNYSDELLDTMREYSPAFSSMGMNADEMMSILINGAQAGAWNLDKVGDAVKEFNIRAKDNTETTAEGFKEIGLNAKDMGAAIAEGGEAGSKAYMATVAALAAIEDPVKRNQAGVKLFGTAWEDLEAGVVTSMSTTNDAVTNVEGATKKAGDALYNNFGARLQTTLRTAGAALQPLGDTLLKMADEYMPRVESAVSKVTGWFNALSPSAQRMVVIFGLIAAAIGPVLFFLAPIITAIGTLIPLFAAVTAPVWLTIGAIGALIAILAAAYAKSEQFRNIMNLVFNITMQLIVGTIKYYWGLIQLIFQGAFNVIMGIFNTFKGLFTGNWSLMWSGIKQLLTGALQLIWAFIQISLLGRIMGIFRSFASGAGKLVSGFASKILGFFRSMGSGISKTMGSIQNWITSKIRAAVNAGLTSGRSLLTGLSTAFNSILSAARTVFSSAKNAIMNPIKEAKDKVKGWVDDIKGFFTKMKLKIPKFGLPPMPHFTLDYKSVDIMGKNVKVPKGFDVDWYDQGGIFTGPSIIGVGEKRPEFVGALDDLRQIVREESGGSAAGIGRLEVPVYLDRKEIARAIADDIDEQLELRRRRNDRAAGRVNYAY